MTDTMLRLIASLQAWSLTSRRRHDERGSVTTEHVLWAVAVIVIVGVVVAAIKAYVETQAAKIK